jgi:hypothetical protein
MYGAVFVDGDQQHQLPGLEVGADEPRGCGHGIFLYIDLYINNDDLRICSICMLPAEWSRAAVRRLHFRQQAQASPAAGHERAADQQDDRNECD